MFKGVVFDLDGTLIDSPLCFQHIRRELEIPENAFILEFLEELPEPVRLEKYMILEKIELDAAKQAIAMVGVLDLLQELSGRNILLGIFTRNCRSATQLALNELKTTFDMIVTREDAPPKPNPEGLRKFLKAWDIGGDELLFVGDSRFDIECGIGAGVKTALFTNGWDGKEFPSADFVIRSYNEFWTTF